MPHRTPVERWTSASAGASGLTDTHARSVTAMTEPRAIKFSTDLVTFYAPSFWGGSGNLDDIDAVVRSAGWDPARFWERILDASRDAGLDGIEITFRPGDWHSAISAYGSAEGFSAAL